MRFYFDIDDEDFEYEGLDFKTVIREAAISTAADKIIRDALGNYKYSDMNCAVRDIIKEHTPEIIDATIKRLSDQIAAKKAIVNLTPKVSELAAIDKENIAYFEKMIDKAIAKRFGG